MKTPKQWAEDLTRSLDSAARVRWIENTIEAIQAEAYAAGVREERERVLSIIQRDIDDPYERGHVVSQVLDG